MGKQCRQFCLGTEITYGSEEETGTPYAEGIEGLGVRRGERMAEWVGTYW